MKKIVKIISIIFIVLITALLFAANIATTYSLSRKGSGGNRNKLEIADNRDPSIAKIIDNKIIDEQNKTKEFLQENSFEKVTIKSNDGLNLAGFIIKQKEYTPKWIIIVHGYRKDHIDMADYTRNFYNRGFNTLTIDLRACGESEGEYLSYGYFEKNDIASWCDYIISIDNKSEIVVFGRSMGAATVMQYAGIDDKKQVKCFIEDCGFTNAWDITKKEMKTRFNLPAFPLLHLSNLLGKIRAGFFLDEADSVDALKKCDKPMLFIHGTSDNYVPFGMMKILYDAIKTDKKEMLIAEGAGHIESVYLLGDEYYNKIIEFISSIL